MLEGYIMKKWIVICLSAMLIAGCAVTEDHCKKECSKKVCMKNIQKTAPVVKVTEAELQKLSDQLAVTKEGSELSWFDAKNLRVEGKGWTDTTGSYDRLPARAESFATDKVWGLSKNTASVCIHFVSNSREIHVEWDGGGAMNHMAAAGNSGLDLYIRRGNDWVYKGTGRPNTTRTQRKIATVYSDNPEEYLLNLPLYHNLNTLEIGIKDGAYIAPAPRRVGGDAKPIVFYGTSITQGGCSSRAGMCHVSILGRWMEREVINLGFSGAGRMEPELAGLFTELDPEVFVLECLPNLFQGEVPDRVPAFVKILREKRPNMPILLVANPNLVDSHQENVNLKKVFDDFIKAGDKNLYYLASAPQVKGQENGTVDGIHMTDLGFFRLSKAYYPILFDIITNK